MTERRAGTPSEPPRQTETHDPTPEEVVEIGTAAGEAVDPNTQSPQEARQAVHQATTQRAQQLRITLHPDAINAIADGTIAELERRGAFREPEREVQSPEPQEAQPNPPQEAPAAATPRKGSFAERFLGGR